MAAVSKPERVIIDKYKAVYFAIPKVACSSIKASISKSIGLDIPRELIHRNIPKVRGRLSDEYNDYYKFTFVRNPYDRIVSCFRSKIVPDKAGKTTKWLVNGVSIGIYKMHGDLFWGDMSFLDFCKSVSKIPDSEANEHFRSQTAFICKKNTLLVDYIGKFESIGDDFETVAKKINSDMELIHFGNKSKRRGYEEYLTDEIRDIVYKRFENDFVLLDYSKY